MARAGDSIRNVSIPQAFMVLTVARRATHGTSLGREVEYVKQWLIGREEGQGLVEYGLIIFLVAVVVIAILVLLGPQIGNVFSDINTSI